MRSRVFGIDFSGGREAGLATWVAGGVLEGEQLQITSCRPAAELPGSGREREQCLKALRQFLAAAGDSVVGCDFPFGLPAALLDESDWGDWLHGLAAQHATAESFRDDCRRRTGGKELRRLTDREAHTPFSAYNLRMYRQTFHGLCGLLEPLVAHGAICMLPMQAPAADKPWLIEICPASTLKRLALYASYKGKTPAHANARRTILSALEQRAGLQIADAVLRSRVLADHGGDALDSVIAALAVYRALQDPRGLAGDKQAPYAREGYVYM